jgi:glutathione synthase
MRIGFVVNDIATEESNYTTTRLAMTRCAWARGLVRRRRRLRLRPDQSSARARRGARSEKYATGEAYLADLRGKKVAKQERISARDLDVLMLRNDPAEDASSGPGRSRPASSSAGAPCSRGASC